jgi:hypothetical protein
MDGREVLTEIVTDGLGCGCGCCGLCRFFRGAILYYRRIRPYGGSLGPFRVGCEFLIQQVATGNKELRYAARFARSP